MYRRETGQPPWRPCILTDQIRFCYFVEGHLVIISAKPFSILTACFRCFTLNAPIATKVICFSRLLKCLRILYCKQCGPRSVCSNRSSLFWVHTVCFYTQFVSNARQLFAAEDFCRRHFQMHFFLGAFRIKI